MKRMPWFHSIHTEKEMTDRKIREEKKKKKKKKVENKRRKKRRERKIEKYDGLMKMVVFGANGGESRGRGCHRFIPFILRKHKGREGKGKKKKIQ